MNEGVIGLNKRINGFVNFTNAFMKKNSESSLWKMFIATLPIRVHIMTPAPDAKTMAMIDEVRIPSGKTVLGKQH